MTRLARTGVWLGAALTVLFVLTGATLLVPVWHDPTSGFVARKGTLAAIDDESEVVIGRSRILERRLHSDTGLAVDVAVQVPDGTTTAGPTVLMLGGYETGRDAVRLVGAVDGITIAALSYPSVAPRNLHGVRAVMHVSSYQRGVLDTVPSILLAADWLVQQPYVDPKRLELVGVSLGAFFVAPAGALDSRFRRVWIVHGSGDPRAVIEFALRDDVRSPTLRRIAAAVLNRIAAGDRLAAERWVGRIAPRPVIVINSGDDERLPRSGIAVLHAALRDPHEILRTRGQHVEPGRADVLEQLRSDVLSRIR